MSLKEKCIDLIIEDAINTDSKDDFIASLMINGLGGKALKKMTEEELLQEVYDRWSYAFDPQEADEIAEDDEKLKAWILKQNPNNWFERCGY